MASMLGPNEGLRRGESLISANGRYRLDLQEDGNLVLYRQTGGATLWSSGTAGMTVSRAVMQDDGNLVIYGYGTPLWASNTAGRPGSFLILQNDGNLVIYQPTSPVWASGTFE